MVRRPCRTMLLSKPRLRAVLRTPALSRDFGRGRCVASLLFFCAFATVPPRAPRAGGICGFCPGVPWGPWRLFVIAVLALLPFLCFVCFLWLCLPFLRLLRPGSAVLRAS